MKKIFALLLAMLMVFSLAACNTEKPDETQPSKDPYVTEPDATEPNVDPDAGDTTIGEMESKLQIIFENDAITAKMIKMELDKATKNAYKQPQTPDGKVDKAILNKLVFTFIDANDETTHLNEEYVAPEGALQLVFDNLNYDLLSSEDFNLNWEKPESGEIFEMVPGEFIAALDAKYYSNVRVAVVGYFDSYDGENKADSVFIFTAEPELKHQFNEDAAAKVPVALTETGATITLNYNDIFKALGFDKSTLKNGDVLHINAFVIDRHSENTVAGIEEYTVTFNGTLPETLVLVHEYDNATEVNDRNYRNLVDWESVWYVYVDISVNETTLDAEDLYTNALLAEVSIEYDSKYAPKEPVETTPETTGPVEQDPTTGEPEDTTGGNE